MNMTLEKLYQRRGASQFISDKLIFIVRNDLQFAKKSGVNSVAIELAVTTVRAKINSYITGVYAGCPRRLFIILLGC